MKKIQFLKVAAAVILAVGLMFLLKGCKKTQNNGLTPKQQDEFAAIIKKTYGGPVSASFVTPINKTADEVFYKNSAGKMENIYGGAAAKPPQGCQYSCFNTNNPANLGYISYTLDYAERFYICEASADKSSVRVKWTVTLPTVPEIVAGTNNVQNTFCNVKFTNTASGATQVYVISAANMQGKAFGQVFNCQNAFLFEITGFVNQIPNAYFQSGWVVSAQLSLDIYCPVLGYVTQSSYVDGPAFSQNSYLPCNRVDKVIVNPSPNPTTPTSITGLYTGSCLPPGGMQPIDYHQVEYRQVTTTNGDYSWDAQGDIVRNGIPQPANGSPDPLLAVYGGVSNLPQMVWGTGTWLIRYRNVKTGSCNQINGNALPAGSHPNTNGNWNLVSPSLWVTEKWNMF